MEIKKCIVCNMNKEEGIFIKGEFICTSCEEKIVECDITNDLTNKEYEVYLNIIKKEIVEKHLF